MEYDFAVVLPFVQARVPGLACAQDARAIGLRRDGDLVGGMLYEGLTAEICGCTLPQSLGRDGSIGLSFVPAFYTPSRFVALSMEFTFVTFHDPNRGNTIWSKSAFR